MNYIFLMDPLDKVIAEKDTTLALMVGAHRRGHNVFALHNGGIVRKDNKTYFHVTPVVPQFKKADPFIKSDGQILADDDVHVVFIRTDPPFGERYLHNTWLLDLLPPTIPVINRPDGIRSANEKIWAVQFSSLVPRTIVASRKQALLEFLNEEKDVIAKPTDSFGGQSVFHIKSDRHNAKVILETLTDGWDKDIILQEFIPEAAQGDKRILLLDGEPLGAVLRRHAEDDHRNNFFTGGKPLATEITQRDLEIIECLKPHLKSLGLYFVGIDIIGRYLIEVNVTSPTCLQEMNRFYQKRLEEKVIEFSENLVDQAAGNTKIPLWKE